jgi:hypothetical protein
MQEVIIAIFALGIGLLFCFYGYKAMRILFPLWGLVAGFWAGAELVHAITGDGFLSTALGIMVGIILGLVFAVLAYLYYAVAVVIFLGFAGFWIGAGFIKLLGLNGNVLSTLVGISLGIVFATIGVIGNAPKYFLLLITAFAGAALMVSAVLLVANIIDPSTLSNGAVTAVANQSWIWKIFWVGLGLVGYINQLASTEAEELAWAAEWEGK